MLELLSLFLLLLVGWWWFDSLRAREIAVREARVACEAENLQFLDDTVGISNVKLIRNEQGRLIWQRSYDFEFSTTGNNRHRGSIVLQAHHVSLINLGLPPNTHLHLIP